MEIARACRARLKRLFLEHPGGRTDEALLADIKDLCLGALRAVDDPACAGRLLTIHCCAAALYSDCAHRHWNRRLTSGVDVLRQKIFRALNGYQRRLYQLAPPRHWHDSCSTPGAHGDERATQEPSGAQGHPPAPGGGEGLSPGF